MPVYKLDDSGNPVMVNDLQEWAAWLHKNRDKLVLRKSDIKSGRKYITTITTRFCGQVNGVEEPLVWITETIDGGEVWKTSSKSQALENHERMVRMLKLCYKAG